MIDMKVKKVALVNPFPYYAKEYVASILPPVGLAYLAAVLRERDIECIIIDAQILRMRNDDVIKRLSNFDPDMIGLTSNIVSARACIELSKTIKEQLNKPVVIGGPYASIMVGKTLTSSGAFCIIRGEGEDTVVDLINNLDSLSKVRGISYVSKGKVKHNPDRELIKNLDSLPFPAYDLLPNLKLYRSRSRRSPSAPILTSRGCPYGCIYCSKTVFGRIFRFRSAENVIKEIEMLVNDFGVKQIDILDDNFTLIRENAERVFDMIIEKKIKIAINLQSGIRVETLTQDFVKKMKRAGVFKTGIGIESGEDRILKIIKKSSDLKKINQAIRWFRSEGIIVYGFFMIGLPYETKADVKKTIKFAKMVNPHIANFTITTAFPDTELYEMLQKNGITVTPLTEYGSERGFFSAKTYYSLNSLSREEIIEYDRKAFKSFYFRPTKVLDMLLSIKSLNELKWTIRAVFEIFKLIF